MSLYSLVNYDAINETKHTDSRMKKVRCKLVIYTPINECYFYKVICNFKKKKCFCRLWYNQACLDWEGSELMRLQSNANFWQLEI